MLCDRLGQSFETSGCADDQDIRQSGYRQAALAIADVSKKVCNGVPTAAENLGYLETNISWFGPSL
ncbi:hypothetical protein DFP91_4367 [Pseudorhodoplanes sinuspersici]|nr:hypothetical protein DFP91_4367 [Pseudorhodoplanes sinuspersici]